MIGRNLGSAFTLLASRVSWYKDKRFKIADTAEGIDQPVFVITNQCEDAQASEASSASLKRPGRNQVSDRIEDSIVLIVDALWIKNDSYFANSDGDEEAMLDSDDEAEAGGRRRSKLQVRLACLDDRFRTHVASGIGNGGYFAAYTPGPCHQHQLFPL